MKLKSRAGHAEGNARGRGEQARWLNNLRAGRVGSAGRAGRTACSAIACPGSRLVHKVTADVHATPFMIHN